MSEEENEPIVGEVITGVNEGGEPGGTRKLRVYDKANGDFVIEIPSEATVTFGYFNPAAAGGFSRQPSYDMGNGAGGQTMKTTALRIYEKGAKSSQIGCFLGVQGFRDMRINITRLRQKVTVETQYENDGDGYIKHASEQQRQLVQVVEDEDIPF